MVANFEKQADQPKRDRLKASKKSWNHVVGLLRAKLKAFQKAVNGHGDADAQLPELDLKDPFPVEFHTYLASIVEDYDKAIKGADFIMDLQDDFSLTRRKSQKELRELAAEIDTHDQKIAEASWWGSRAWAWFALHRLGKDVRRTRLRMLNFVRQSIHALNIVEYQFTSSSSASDVQGILGLTRFINLWIGGYLARLQQLKQIEAKDTDVPQLQEAPGGDKKPEPGEEDIGPTIVGGPPPAAGPDIATIIAQSDGGILKARIELIQNHSDKDLVGQIKGELTRLKNTIKAKKPDDDIKDVYKNLLTLLDKAEKSPDVKNALTEEEEYRKIAQDVLQRWWGRKKLEWRGGKPDELKLLISNEIREAVKALKELMDIIESLERSTDDISAKSDEVAVKLKSAGETALQLAEHYRLEWRMEPDPKKRPARLEEGISRKLKNLMKAL